MPHSVKDISHASPFQSAHMGHLPAERAHVSLEAGETSRGVAQMRLLVRDATQLEYVALVRDLPGC